MDKSSQRQIDGTRIADLDVNTYAALRILYYITMLLILAATRLSPEIIGYLSLLHKHSSILSSASIHVPLLEFQEIMTGRSFPNRSALQIWFLEAWLLALTSVGSRSLPRLVCQIRPLTGRLGPEAVSSTIHAEAFPLHHIPRST